MGESRSKRFEFGALAMLFAAAVAVAVGYYHVFFTIDLPAAQARFDLHAAIIDGNANSPYRYRILVPFLAEGLSKFLTASGLVSDVGGAFLWSFRIIDTVAVFGTLVALFYWFREFFSKDIALVGAMFVGATMLIPLRDHYYQPWSYIEPGIFALGLLALFLATVSVGSLNRETAVMLSVAAFSVAVFDFINAEPQDRGSVVRRGVLWVGVSFLLFLGVFLGLRGVLGSAKSAETVAGLIASNIRPEGLTRTACALVGFLTLFWVMASMGWKHAPQFVRRVSLYVPFYLAAYLLFGVWHETRLLMVLYPVLIPMGLAFMYSEPD